LEALENRELMRLNQAKEEVAPDIARRVARERAIQKRNVEESKLRQQHNAEGIAPVAGDSDPNKV